MSAAVPLTGFSPARELPNRELFYSELGLFDFQIDGLAECYVRTGQADGGVIAVWDTGIGKTVLGIVLSAYLYADAEIDQVVVICERNKRKDWAREFERFTALSVHLYHGSGRQQRLAKAGAPHVLVTTYETGRAELMQREKAAGKRGKGKAVDGPLVETLGLRGKRTLWIFDEPTKMKNRGAEVHHSFDYLLTQLRRGPYRQRVLGHTATPMERDFEDAYNLGRIFFPTWTPTVAEFERRFTVGQDRYFNLIFRETAVDEFVELFQRGIIRKRKTDPDVVAQFPKMIERSITVEMGPDEAEFMAAVEDVCYEHATGLPHMKESEASRLWNTMRYTAGHPASHLHLENVVSRSICATLSPAELRSIGSAKTKELIERLRPLVKGQGAQVVLFSYYPSVIIEVARELREAGFDVAEHHGYRGDAENESAKAEFIAGEREILFSSDIGAKGLNLQNAQYVFEYESALTYANRTQRINRVHRIVSDKPSVTCTTLVLHNSVEQNIFAGVMDRNEKQDLLLGDEEDGTGFIPAEQRREMLKAFRRTRRKN